MRIWTVEALIEELSNLAAERRLINLSVKRAGMSRYLRMACHEYLSLEYTRSKEKSLCRDEEISFGRTLQKGLERFNRAKGAAQGTLFSGRDAFELYDTFGFPPDLTQVQLPA